MEGDVVAGAAGSTLSRFIIGVIDSGEGEDTVARMAALHDSDGDDGTEEGVS